MSFTENSLPTERSFGLLFTFVFVALCGYAWHSDAGKSAIYSYLITAVVIGLTTVLAPRLLSPFNKVWFALGELLGKIVSPIFLGVIFFAILTPIGLLTRWFGRDELRLKKHAGSTYWIERVPPGPAADSFKNQF